MSERRRSLLSSNTPYPVVRSVRPSLKPEDAPDVPSRRPTIPERLPAELPPDPTAVDFDFGPEELPLEALEAIDIADLAEIPPGAEQVIDPTDAPAPPVLESFSLFGDDDDEPTIEGATPWIDEAPEEGVLSGPQTAQDATNSDPITEPGAFPEPDASTPGTLASAPRPRPEPPAPAPAPLARPTRRSPLANVPLVFVASMAATTLLTILPWFSLLSPRLHEVREAQRVERDAALAARIVEVPRPVPVPVAVPAPPVEAPVEADAAPEEPTRRDFALTKPKPRPARRPRPRPAKSPAPAPPSQANPPEPKAAPKVEPKPEPKPVAPAAARALSGRYGGTSKGEPIVFDLEFLADNRLRATIQRGASQPITTTGRYALAGERATFAVVEPTEGGASYSATATSKGVSGRISYPSGKNHRFSLGR